MEFIRFTLLPRSNFQLTSFGSSMLSRVIIRNLILLYGEDVLDEIKVEDTFSVSDLLPWSFNRKIQLKSYFLPFPKFDLTQTPVSDLNQIKKLKKVKFISEDIFYDFFQDLRSSPSVWDRYIIKNDLLIKKDNQIMLEIEETSLPHAVPYRVKNSSISHKDTISIRSIDQFYHTKVMWFRNGGLYFLLYVPNEMEEKIISAINLIEEIGLGKKISSGSGGFSISNKEHIQFDKPDKNNESILLSQFIPSEKNIDSGIFLKYYGLTHYSPTNPHFTDYRSSLNSITYVSSGSVLKGVESSIIGKFCDIGEKNSPSIAWGKGIVINGGKIFE